MENNSHVEHQFIQKIFQSNLTIG